jgi:hypothetical protein
MPKHPKPALRQQEMLRSTQHPDPKRRLKRFGMGCRVKPDNDEFQGFAPVEQARGPISFVILARSAGPRRSGNRASTAARHAGGRSPFR